MEQRKNQNSKRIGIRLLLATMLLVALPSSILTLGKNTSQQDKEIPLSYTLRLAKAPRCVGEAILAETVITNISSEDIVIDIKSLWARVSFVRSISSSKGASGGSLTIIGDDFSTPSDLRRYLILKPHQSYKETKEFSLTEKFFQAAASYSLAVTSRQFREGSQNGVPFFIGAVTSNQVGFELSICKRNKLVKKTSKKNK